MKYFDIYLSNRLTECDILVYSIPYREGMCVVNRLILNSCLDNYLLKKMIAIEARSALVPHIDTMIKICREKLDAPLAINADVDLSQHNILYPSKSNLLIHQEDLSSLTTKYLEISGQTKLLCSILPVTNRKFAGGGSVPIGISADVQKLLKRSLESSVMPLTVDASVDGISETNFLEVIANDLVQ